MGGSQSLGRRGCPFGRASGATEPDAQGLMPGLWSPVISHPRSQKLHKFSFKAKLELQGLRPVKPEQAHLRTPLPRKQAEPSALSQASPSLVPQVGAGIDTYKHIFWAEFLSDSCIAHICWWKKLGNIPWQLTIRK